MSLLNPKQLGQKRPASYLILNLLLIAICAGPQGRAAGPNSNSGSSTLNSQNSRNSQNSQNSKIPFASGAVPFDRADRSGIDPRSQQDDQFEKCDQDCLYQKANGNVSAQLSYLISKIKYINALMTIYTNYDPDNPTGPDPETIDKRLRPLLGSFCGAPSEKNGNKPEDLVECTNRYNEVNKFVILKFRGSLGAQEASIAKLSGAQCDASGNCTHANANTNVFQAGSPKQGNSTQKYEQMPYFSKAQDLAKQAEAAKITQLNNVVDSAQWEKDVSRSLKPSHDDFVKFKTVPLDANFQASGTTEVPMMNPDGTLVYDEAAYQLAIKDYERSFGTGTGGSTSGTVSNGAGTGNSQNMLHATVGDGSLMSSKIRAAREQMIKDFQVAPDTKVDQKSAARMIYDQSHDSLVKEVNTGLWGQSSVSFPGSQTKLKAPESIKDSHTNSQSNSTEPPPNGDLDTQLKPARDSQTGPNQNSGTTNGAFFLSFHGNQVGFAPAGATQSNSQPGPQSTDSAGSRQPGSAGSSSGNSSGASAAAPGGASGTGQSKTGTGSKSGKTTPSAQQLNTVSDPGVIYNLDFN